jgi:uncharacterized membrane protein YeaQ/YmgE (transglycosylase-associated protein family)
MSLAALLVLVVIAAVCGAIGKAIAGSARGGLVVSIALGFVGALLGPWVARQLHLSEPFMVTIGGQPFPILWSIIGAALFVAIIHLISGRVATALPVQSPKAAGRAPAARPLSSQAGRVLRRS